MVSILSEIFKKNVNLTQFIPNISLTAYIILSIYVHF